MKVELKLVLSLILEAVKAETHLKARMDRSAGDNQSVSNAVAYHEDAGDEEVHERKLLRGIYTSVDKLRSYITDYMSDLGVAVSDNNIQSEINSDNDTITITLDVTDRFNVANNDALARYCSKYVEDNTLVLWWGAINQSQMQYYQALLADDLAAIQRLFTKRASHTPIPTYTHTLTLSAGVVNVYLGESETISYEIDDNALDDIKAKVTGCNIARVEGVGNGVLSVSGLRVGRTTLIVESRHNSEARKEIAVMVERRRV